MATDFLDYELYRTGGTHHGWTDTTQSGRLHRREQVRPRRLTIYGRVPANQDVAAGSYTDTVVAQAEF